MPNIHIAKRAFLLGMGCTTRGWYAHNGVGESSPTLSDRFRWEEGQEVGRRACAEFPTGAFAKGAEHTHDLMNDSNVEVIFEAEIRVNGLVARADVLVRNGDSWKLIEVKSATNESDELVDDIVYTAKVFGLAGIPLSACCLWLVSGDYRLGMHDSEFFHEVELTDVVRERIDAWSGGWQSIRDDVAGADRPEPTIKWECRKCDHYGERCVGKDVEHPLFNLPRISEKKFFELDAMGVSEIPDVPEDYELTANQERVRQAISAGDPIISDDLSKMLVEIEWPA